MDSFIDGGFFQFFLLFFFFLLILSSLLFDETVTVSVLSAEMRVDSARWRNFIDSVRNVFMFRACLFFLRPLQFLYNSVILVKVYKYDNNVIVFNRANRENNRSPVKYMYIYIYIYIFMLLTSKTKNETRSSKRVSPRIKVKTIIRIISFPCKM